MVPQPIIQAKFTARPFRIKTIFKLVELFHHIRRFTNSTTDKDQHPYLAYRSSNAVSQYICPPRRAQCWYFEVSYILQSFGISMDRLSPLMYSLDAPGNLLPNKQEMNGVIKEDIYRQAVHPYQLDHHPWRIEAQDDLLCRTIPTVQS